MWEGMCLTHARLSRLTGTMLLESGANLHLPMR